MCRPDPPGVAQGYRDCYVAFLDILGFKELVATRSCREMLSLFEALSDGASADVAVDGRPLPAFGDVRHKVMSDSLVLYVDAAAADSFYFLLLACQTVQVSLLNRREPVLVRGGVARGGLFCQGDIIFGEGLVQAYLMESRVARFPRIVFTRSLLEDGTRQCRRIRSCMADLVAAYDEDGLCLVNFLSLSRLGDCGTAVGYLDRVLCHCRSVLDTSCNLSLREKCLWLRAAVVRAVREQRALVEDAACGREFLARWGLA